MKPKMARANRYSWPRCVVLKLLEVLASRNTSKVGFRLFGDMLDDRVVKCSLVTLEFLNLVPMSPAPLAMLAAMFA